MLRNSASYWGSLARSLHWLMAALIAAQWVLGKVGHEMARSPAKLEVLTWHKSLGIALLALVLVRIAWRFANPTPALPRSVPAWETWLARATQGALYALMFAIPLSGWIMNSAKNMPFSLFGWLPWPDIAPASESLGEAAEEVHEALAALLVLILAVHVLAALRHHFLLKNDVLKRMLPGSRAKT